jgi:hypothetical protein
VADSDTDRKRFPDLLSWLGDGTSVGDQRYVEIHARLVKYFQWNNCHTPEECADETLSRITTKVEEDGVIRDSSNVPVQNKSSYIFSVARNQLHECWRKQKNEPLPLPDEFETADPDSLGDTLEIDADEEEIIRDCQRRCLKKFRKKDKERWFLIRDYYQETNEAPKLRRSKLADRLGMSRNALACRIEEIRQKLRGCVEECLKGKNL